MEAVVLSFYFIADKNLSDVTQGEMFTDQVMYKGFIHSAFSHIRQRPSSLSDASSEIFLEVTLQIMDISAHQNRSSQFYVTMLHISLIFFGSFKT